jgi:type IX secretion system PorP/SprF family membrane protein
MKILKNKLEKDVFSVGVVVVRDELYNKSVSNTVAMFSTAYHDRIAENDYLAAGLQGGLYQRYLDMNAFTYPEQWNPNTGMASNSVTEQFQDMNAALFDMNLGLIWYHYIGKSSSVFLGGSVFHLTQPKAEYLNSAGMIPRRYVIHGGTRMSLDNNFSIIPNIILMRQDQATDVVLGTTVEYRTGNGNAIKTGGWFRFSDTFSFYMGMEFQGVEIGASYDFNSIEKYLGQNKGGVEFSLIFNSFYKKNVSLKGNPGLVF